MFKLSNSFNCKYILFIVTTSNLQKIFRKNNLPKTLKTSQKSFYPCREWLLKNFILKFADKKSSVMEYMSQEGYDKLVAELYQLEHVEYPKVKEALVEAREKGDLSENFEYHAAKREQAKLISRIRFKQRVLEFARVIDSQKLNSDTVGLLKTVYITNLGNNGKISYTIVSPHEANIQEKKISIKSPIAQALLGKKVGDVVDVKVPAGTMQLRIDSIRL